MKTESSRQIRCAIYTRKSTEHGLELEFNSLDAQREACESYIKSQASQGWKALPDRYDDPAFSGGNLERPALKQLLSDIEAGKVDVVVVYKIDRLTRSLADFAKLVEAFDARSISFVAVTQQFNTTSSMGRLTLNVLLSFAQFERELSSERVRDKIAASRRKGKWTGGTIPFGYRTDNKKLIIDKAEAATVRYIFKRYLELGSFEPLVLDLDQQRIRGRARKIKGKTNVASRFTYGPLAYLLNNRIYLGEVSHKSKWHIGEHAPIIDAAIFDSVQARLRSNSVTRKNRRSESGALLMSKLFDDCGNRMSPSYSVKQGVRYPFYISTALLRGRRDEAGSLSRISAIDLELSVVKALRAAVPDLSELSEPELIERLVSRITVSKTKVAICTVASPDHAANDLVLPWSAKPANCVSIEHSDDEPSVPDTKLIRALARAHTWMSDPRAVGLKSIDELTKSEKAHSKTLRKELRLAFLAPDIVEAILHGEQPAGLTLTKMLPTLPLSWVEQRRSLGFRPAEHPVSATRRIPNRENTQRSSPI